MISSPGGTGGGGPAPARLSGGKIPSGFIHDVQVILLYPLVLLGPGVVNDLWFVLRLCALPTVSGRVHGVLLDCLIRTPGRCGQPH